MTKKPSPALAALLFAAALGAARAERPVQFTVGSEAYRETYREYTNGSERFMQERGRMWSLNAGGRYAFNGRHAAKVEGRYSRGKSDYTGQYLTGSDYGDIVIKNIPRRAYDVRASYEYTKPLSERLDLVLETGLGYRTLKDSGSRADSRSYDRKNQILYARAGAGLDIKLPHGFEIGPKVSYNQMLRGRQHSYPGNRDYQFKQSGGKGVEVEVPVSKRFANGSKLSLGPFYRGWKVPDSDYVYETDENGNLWRFREPKNHTHEAGLKLQYQF